MPEEFSRRQVELILRRTAELERARSDAPDEITAADLERVAAELGMSQQALGQAIAEARAGLLAPPGEAGAIDKLFGSAEIEVRRHIPGDLAAVQAAVERFFEEQGFQVRRRRGDLTVWEPASDVWSRLRRAFRAGPYRVPRSVVVEVQLAEIPGGAHPVLVRLRVDARELRGSRVTGAAAALVAGAGMAVGGAILLPMPVELALWAGGAAAGAAGTLGGRASYRAARARLETALERFLDFLEQEPATPSQPKDLVDRLLDFLGRDWGRS